MSTEIDSQVGGAGRPAASDGKLDRRVMVVAGVVVLGAIMSILDITVVAVAQRTFQDTFDKTQAQVAWTSTAYTLALATVIPMTGWAADRFGTKRLYILALVLFTAGSALCSTATSLEMLVAFRVLQGLGGGMLMPLGMTILTRAAGPERLGRVMAILGVPMLLGPIFGPILGGWLIDVASWHWIFLINVPIGIVAAVYAWRVLDRDQVHPSESFDFVGMLLLSPGPGAVPLRRELDPGREAGARHDVHLQRSWSAACVGLALVVAFVPWALRRKNIHPLVQLRLFTNRYMTVAVITMTLFAMAFFGASPAVHALLPAGARRDAAGLRLAGRAAGLRRDADDADRRLPGRQDRPRQGRADRAGRSTRSGMGMLAFIDDKTPYSYIMTAFVIMGLGMGATMMPVFTAALASLKDHDIARGSTLMNITQQVVGLDGHGAVLGAAHQRLQPAPRGQRDAGDPERRRRPASWRPILDQLGLTDRPGRPIVATGLHYMGQAFGDVFLVADGAGRALPGPGVLPAAQAGRASRSTQRAMMVG